MYIRHFSYNYMDSSKFTWTCQTFMGCYLFKWLQNFIFWENPTEKATDIINWKKKDVFHKTVEQCKIRKEYLICIPEQWISTDLPPSVYLLARLWDSKLRCSFLGFPVQSSSMSRGGSELPWIQLAGSPFGPSHSCAL